MQTQYSKGEAWIKLLRAYGPVPDGKAQEAEHLDRLCDRLGIKHFSFEHPKQETFNNVFLTNGTKKVAIITGTAGDGKTTLCLNLLQTLTGQKAWTDRSNVIQEYKCLNKYGSEKVTVIFDVSAWRKDTEDGKLRQECIDTLEAAASYAYGNGGQATLLAVNDGQLHEVYKSLPQDVSPVLQNFFKEVLRLHALGKTESDALPNCVLVNLSSVPSDRLMELCLDSILLRDEWNLLDSESTDDPKALFGPNCPIKRNFEIIQSPFVKERFLQIAMLADASGYHLPVRSIYLLIVNAILGHPDFRNKLVNPGVEVERHYSSDNWYKAAFHLNFFGLNLGEQSRKKFLVYNFLSNLRIGHETINDIDEIIIFGAKHPELENDYNAIVQGGVTKQDPSLSHLLRDYLLGIIEKDEDVQLLRKELSNERKRLFFCKAASDRGYDFWLTSVVHHAESYINDFLKISREGKIVDIQRIEQLSLGLNRVWTGLLVKPGTRDLYVSSGFDLTTAPISDVLVQRLSIDEVDQYIATRCGKFDKRLQLWIQRGKDDYFVFDLTILRFEFLQRIAKGAMPTSFSKEIYSDFLALKQKAIQKLASSRSSPSIKLIDLNNDGDVKITTLNLNVL